MTKVVFVILAASSLAIGAVACKKDGAGKGSNSIDTKQIALNNKGRFVCSANGKEWLADLPTKKYVVKYEDPNISFNQDIYGVEGVIFGDTLNLSGARVAGTDSSALAFEIVLRSGYLGSYTIGNYPPKNAGKAAAYFYSKLGKVAKDIGYSGYNISGTLNISAFNDSARMCSGTFNLNMSAKNPSNPKTPNYTITNGVFYDMKFD